MVRVGKRDKTLSYVAMVCRNGRVYGRLRVALGVAATGEGTMLMRKGSKPGWRSVSSADAGSAILNGVFG